MSETTIETMPTDAAPMATRIHRRRMLGSMLERTLTAEGYAATRAANWTLTGLTIAILGIISDLSQIFGDVTLYGLVLSATIFLALGVVVGLRTKYCRACAFPCVVAFLFFVAFSVLLGGQELMASIRETGPVIEIESDDGQMHEVKLDNTSLLGHFQGAQKIQLEMFRLLGGLTGQIARLHETVEATRTIVDETRKTAERTEQTAAATQRIVTEETGKSAAHRDRVEELLEQNQVFMEALVRQTSVTHEALVKRVIEMGARPDIAIEDIPGFLADYARQAEQALARLRTETPGTGDIAEIREAVAADVEAGNLDAARRRLVEAREAMTGHTPAADLRRAALLAEEGHIERLDINHYTAADRFLEAAELAAPDPSMAMNYRALAANSLAVRGDSYADLDAVRRSLEILWDPRTTEIPERDPVWRAGYFLDYGMALTTHGRLSRDVDSLRGAVEVIQLALGEFERGRAPALWASIQANLGVAYLELGTVALDPEAFRLATAAFERQIEEDTRERAPREWAIAKMHLGNAYSQIAATTMDSDDVQRAVLAYTDAIQVQTQENDAAGLASSNHNLGLLALTVGRHRRDVSLLDVAEDALRDSLSHVDRRRSPVNWGGSHKVLGEILWAKADATGDPESARAAMDEMALALQELTPGRDPAARASALQTFGNAAIRVGDQDRNVATISDGIRALTEAVSLTPADDAPLDRAFRQHDLGFAHTRRMAFLNTSLDADLAETALTGALKALDAEKFNVSRGMALGLLAEVYAWRGVDGRNLDLTKKAVATFEKALGLYRFDENRAAWTTAQKKLAEALAVLGHNGGGIDVLEKGLLVLDNEEKGARAMGFDGAIADIDRRRQWFRDEIARQRTGTPEIRKAGPVAE